MDHIILDDLSSTMSGLGFHPVPDEHGIPDGVLLLKRQTWNTNRAIVVIAPKQMPDDFGDYLRNVRKAVAFRCGFFPIFWGIGIQVIVASEGALRSDIDPAAYVATIDNQWAIVQSIFVVDLTLGAFIEGRSWGQVITGVFQEAISETLQRHFAY